MNHDIAPNHDSNPVNCPHLVALGRALSVGDLLLEEELGRLEPYADVLPGQVALVKHLADQGDDLGGELYILKNYIELHTYGFQK